GLLLAALSVGRSPTADRRGALDTCRFIVMALYFWSAIQKMNVTFTRTWPEVVAGLGPRAAGILGAVGWLVPLVELSIALGLGVPRLRRPAVALAVAAHTAIVAMLVVSRENSVVWPWNVALATATVVLFRDASWNGAKLLRGDRTLRHRARVVLAGVLPMLSFVGLWDAFLSSALYSGNTIAAVVLVSPETARQLPPIVRENTWQASTPFFIDINRWSYAELNVPMYPAER